tara:strand:+ start:212 stop:487 length:276 start_codon:yes stop_codon:yes gene_type:complete
MESYSTNYGYDPRDPIRDPINTYYTKHGPFKVGDKLPNGSTVGEVNDQGRPIASYRMGFLDFSYIAPSELKPPTTPHDHAIKNTKKIINYK